MAAYQYDDDFVRPRHRGESSSSDDGGLVRGQWRMVDARDHSKARGPRRPRARVFQAKTSEQMRKLMRLVVPMWFSPFWTSRKAAEGAPAPRAIWLAARPVRRTSRSMVVTVRKGAGTQDFVFVGAFPIDNPRYVVFALLDEPKGNKETWNYAGGGWVAAPVVGVN